MKKQTWEKEFDKKFTRKNKGLEDKGKFMDRWFVRETTAEELKTWIAHKKLLWEAEARKKALKDVEELIWLGTDSVHSVMVWRIHKEKFNALVALEEPGV